MVGHKLNRRRPLINLQKMKTDPENPKTIDGYIAGFPPDVQVILEKVRVTIRNAAPAAEEAIKYRLATFVLHQRVCMKGISQFRSLACDEGHCPDQIVFAHGGLEIGE